jgi:hypothetical protein
MAAVETLGSVVEGKDEATLGELVAAELDIMEAQARARGVPDKLIEMMLGQRTEMGVGGIIETVERKLWPPYREGNLAIYIDYWSRFAFNSLYARSFVPGQVDYLQGWALTDEDIALIHEGVLRLLALIPDPKDSQEGDEGGEEAAEETEE